MKSSCHHVLSLFFRNPQTVRAQQDCHALRSRCASDRHGRRMDFLQQQGINSLSLADGLAVKFVILSYSISICDGPNAMHIQPARLYDLHLSKGIKKIQSTRKKNPPHILASTYKALAGLSMLKHTFSIHIQLGVEKMKLVIAIDKPFPHSTWPMLAF